MNTRIVPQKYVLTLDTWIALVVLLGFLGAHALLYHTTGVVKSGLYIGLICCAITCMYHYLRREMYWHSFMFAIIGTISMVASFESLGHLL